MRFDKQIWNPQSSFYDHVSDRRTVDVKHFNEATKAWVSIWLDLVSNDKTAPTKRADVPNLPICIREFLHRLKDVREGFDGGGHRLQCSLRELLYALKEDPVISAKRYPAVAPMVKHGDNLLAFLAVDHPPCDPKTMEKANRACPIYGVKDITSATKLALVECDIAATRLGRSLEYGDRYLEDCVNGLQSLLTRSGLTRKERSQIYYLSASISSQFILRQHSPRSLSELHLISLRGDNSYQAGRALSDRLRSIFTETISPNSCYSVFFRVEPKISTEELLPPYVEIVEADRVQQLAATVSNNDFLARFLVTSECSYLKVACGKIEPKGNRIPDRFTAAVTARAEANKVLDVLFMVRPRTVWVEDWCLVLDETNGRVADVELFREREYAQDEIKVKFLHEAQADLQRALHWYRKAMQSPSDESGLLESWISVEYLAQGLKDGSRGPEIAVIQRYFPQLLAMRSAWREIDYLLWCIRTYLANNGLQLPSSFSAVVAGSSEHERLACLLRLASLPEDSPERQALYKVFEQFPHIAWELELALTRLSSPTGYKEHLQQLRDRFEAMFYRVYALRNEIVHNARVQADEIPLLRKVFGDTLRELYQELLVIFRHDSTITVDRYLRELSQEYSQILEELTNPVTPELLLTMKYHFRANL